MAENASRTPVIEKPPTEKAVAAAKRIAALLLAPPGADGAVASPTAIVAKATKDDLDDFLRIAVDRYHNGETPEDVLVPDPVYEAVLVAYQRRFPKSEVPLVAAPHDGDPNKVALPAWMGSLDKVVDDEAALTRRRAAHPLGSKGTFLLSDKLDGISGLLEVGAGAVRLMTRGDGEFGRDISHLLKLMTNFKLPPAPPTGSKIMVRGELIIPRAEFAALTKKGASARNLANGVVNASKNPNTEVAAALRFMAYELIPTGTNEKAMQPSQQLATLRGWGMPVVESWGATSHELTQKALTESLIKRQAESPFEVDGIVVAADVPHARVSTGNPTTTFAFKSLIALAEMETPILAIEWKVGKDGLLKPTIVFEPVLIKGKQIERATGHNARFVESNKLGPGARVRVVLSGDVIPRVLGLTDDSAKVPPQMPSVPWVWDETHVEARLDPDARNTASKRELGVRQLLHFCEAMSIVGLGPGMVERMWEADIKSVSAVTSATIEALSRIRGVKPTRARTLHTAIANAIARATCATVAEASNAFGHGIGKVTLRAVLTAMPQLAAANGPLPSADELRTVKGVGESTAKKLLAATASFREFLGENPLLAARCSSTPGASGTSGAKRGTPPLEKKKDSVNLAGRSFVFTGFTSDALEAYITSRGGAIKGSVSASTTAVIASDPDTNTNKIKDAKRLGVRIVPLKDVWDGEHVVSDASLSPQ